MAKEDFDRYTKGRESPSKQTYRYKVTDDKKNPFNRYEQDSLLPKTYEDELIKQNTSDALRRSFQTNEDEFKQLGVNNEDKMTYFLLKWVFNAIKRDSSADDPKLKGNAYVTKTDLVKQLSKNDELMKALGYSDKKDISQDVKFLHSAKEGCLQWDEFLEVFFTKQQESQQ